MINHNFAGKVAIVTGAGVGIGREIARQLVQAGAAVLLNDVDEGAAQAAAAEIAASESGACVGVGGDVGVVEVVRGLVQTAVSHFGRLDYVVANAGLTLWNNFFDYTPDDFNRVLSVNLSGSFFLAQAAARQLRQQGEGGRIVFISSVSGHRAIPYLSAYAMSKAGLEMLARQLVVELSPLGITVNCVAPGATLTPRNLVDDPNYEQVWSNLIPLGQVIQPSDIAEAVLFLLSPAAQRMTGQTLTVDGGWTAVSPIPSLDFVSEP